jgi:predicted RNA binding protein YcfA (HicA-like mRNA interferase family)
MPKLRVLSAGEVCAILQRHGFEIVRQRGSHIILRRESSLGSFTVPVPNHSEIAKGTLKSIIAQSGVPAEEFTAT